MRVKYVHDGVTGCKVPMGVDHAGRLHHLPVVMVHSIDSIAGVERVKSARAKAIFTQSLVAPSSLVWGSLELLIEELTLTLELLEVV